MRAARVCGRMGSSNRGVDCVGAVMVVGAVRLEIRGGGEIGRGVVCADGLGGGGGGFCANAEC